jgi:predicted DNA-binding transcriptional regulator AlpA
MDASAVKNQIKLDLLPPLDPNAFYSVKYLARRWGVHQITVFKWAAAGILPKPLRIGPNTSRWIGSDIEAHERARREA